MKGTGPPRVAMLVVVLVLGSSDVRGVLPRERRRAGSQGGQALCLSLLSDWGLRDVRDDFARGVFISYQEVVLFMPLSPVSSS